MKETNVSRIKAQNTSNIGIMRCRKNYLVFLQVRINGIEYI